MSVQYFIDNDQGYLQWIKNNPTGFVLNTGPTEASTYTMLHRSSCDHIAEYEGLTNTGSRSKVCSNDASELYDWCRDNRPAIGRFHSQCKSCTPQFVEPLLYPDEIVDSPGTFIEGARMQVTVNRYERNSKARAQCLAHHGYRCTVCDLDFAERYGELGRGFIHVHHLIPLADLGEGYEIDPKKDLIPVCPNCHAMLHRTIPPVKPEELSLTLRP
jgi:5-methylcytosine-specific restriction protein A